MPRTLKPQLFLGEVYCSPEYLSNGHWAIRRALVTNAALYTNLESAKAIGLTFNELDKDREQHTLFPVDSTKLTPWTPTPLFFQDGKTIIRILLSDEDVMAGVNAAYLKALMLNEYVSLYGTDPSSRFYFWNDSDTRTSTPPDVILMPYTLRGLSYTITRSVH